jgi:prevent-host-death family protein
MTESSQESGGTGAAGRIGGSGGVAKPGKRGYNSYMSTVSLQDLQQNPTALLDRVEAGEHLVVVRDGRPVAELRPIALGRRDPRPFGLCHGSFVVPEDFDAPLPEEVLREFEGR